MSKKKADWKDCLRQGDCVELMRQMPQGSVDLVFADPPFNIGYNYDVYHDKKDSQSYLSWSRQWIQQVHRVLKPTGAFWLAIGDEYAAELKVLSQELGFHCRSWVVWYYTFGVHCTTKFSRSHAHIFHFAKDPKKFTFNTMAVRVPSARQLVYGDGRANPDGRVPDDTWILRPQDCTDGFTPDEDTWYFPRVAGTFKERAGFHGCQMPEQLLARVIRACSNEGELVLDPFSGSATTVTVAKKLGRHWLGFDLSEDYIKRGQARLDGCQPGDLLEGAPEPLISAPTTADAQQTLEKRRDQRTSKRTKTSTTQNVPSILSTPAAPAQTQGLSARLTPSSELDATLIEAFLRTSEGYSLDRLVADPVMNMKFQEQCLRLGLNYQPKDLNRRLFALRKSGKLSGLTPIQRRTEFTWQDSDQFIYASEIAWRQMIDNGHSSLDEILCDPILAARFDELACDLAPGHSSLQYRWGALKLRKSAYMAQHRQADVGDSDWKKLPFGEPNRLPSLPSLYQVIEPKKQNVLYVGATLNFKARPEAVAATNFWKELGSDLFLKVKSFDKSATTFNELLSWQCFIAIRENSILNYYQKKQPNTPFAA